MGTFSWPSALSRAPHFTGAPAHGLADTWLDKDSSGPHGERLYVLYAKVPRPYGGSDWFVQIAGWDPTRAGDNLDRRHPLTTP
jgi:hypothetical protein